MCYKQNDDLKYYKDEAQGYFSMIFFSRNVS